MTPCLVGLFFSTDAMPERDRFPAFCEEVIRRYTALDVRKRDESPFRGVITLRRVGDVDVGTFATSAANFDRSTAPRAPMASSRN